ncbi:MAG: CHASE domain-containing protein, partial [Acidimicrobiales bacterium]
MYERSAGEISGLLRVAVEREGDVVVSTGAYVAANPNITTTELDEWITSVRAFERYPELLAVAAMTYVTNEELPAFLARMRAAPVTPLSAAEPLEVVPPGERPFYCLLQAVVAIGPITSVAPFGVDYCMSAVGPLVLAARDTGEASNIIVPSDAGQQLVVQTPIYRGGVIPSTVEGRRAAYVGSLGTSLAPDALLADVVRGHRDE